MPWINSWNTVNREYIKFEEYSISLPHIVESNFKNNLQLHYIYNDMIVSHIQKNQDEIIKAASFPKLILDNQINPEQFLHTCFTDLRYLTNSLIITNVYNKMKGQI